MQCCPNCVIFMENVCSATCFSWLLHTHRYRCLNWRATSMWSRPYAVHLGFWRIFHSFVLFYGWMWSASISGGIFGKIILCFQLFGGLITAWMIKHRVEIFLEQSSKIRGNKHKLYFQFDLLFLCKYSRAASIDPSTCVSLALNPMCTHPFAISFNHRTPMCSGMKGISMLTRRKQFTIYVSYACGLSTLMVTIAFIMDSVSVPSSIQPGIGVGNCYLKST